MAWSIQEAVKKNGRQVSATLQTEVTAPDEAVFDFVAAEDVLPMVLTGYGLLPAVVRTSGNTGPWDQPGSSRTVHLADDTTSREEVTAYKRPGYFAYQTSNYTFALRYLATSAEGQWWFEERHGRTHIRWTYIFTAKNAVTAVPLWLFVKTQWKGYMRVCIDNIQRHFALDDGPVGTP